MDQPAPGASPSSRSPPPEPTRDLSPEAARAMAGPAPDTAIDFLAPAQQPDELGRLGPYRILEVLGQGGMGMVFEAEDPRLGRMCALETMLPEVAKKPEMKERFLREARAAAQLEHDHIIPIYQVDEDRGVPYIAMPFLKGASLEDWFRQKQKGKTGSPLTEPQILKLGREIARGLAAAHERGLVHRDIKPANIWLDATTGGRVKILDFGLARLSEHAGQQNLTHSGTILGTPAYMAPEQARGEKIDGRADLFSLGVILYRLCTGELPFKGDNPIVVLSALALVEPPSVRERNPAISPALAELVTGLLVKDPAKRIASAREVVQKILAIERSATGGSAAAPGPQPAASASPWQEPTVESSQVVQTPQAASARDETMAELPGSAGSEPTRAYHRAPEGSSSRRQWPLLVGTAPPSSMTSCRRANEMPAASAFSCTPGASSSATFACASWRGPPAPLPERRGPSPTANRSKGRAWITRLFLPLAAWRGPARQRTFFLRCNGGPCYCAATGPIKTLAPATRRRDT